MRLLTYQSAQGPRLGALDKDQVVDLHTASGGVLPKDLLSFLELGDQAWTQAAQALRSGKGAVGPLASVPLLAPISNPGKIICMGLNYRDHAHETGAKIPEEPVFFAKYSTAIIGPGEPIVIPQALTSKVDYEAELAFIIGRRAKNVPAARAMDYVAGYTVVHDVSARDLQLGPNSGGQWIRGKTLDTFCPMGPYLVSRDEIKDPHTLPIRCTVNGRVLQNSNTSNLIFGVPVLLEFLSKHVTLLPGDVIATGTPPGVGFVRKPPIFLQPGDTVTVEVEGVGSLTNPVRGE